MCEAVVALQAAGPCENLTAPFFAAGPTPASLAMMILIGSVLMLIGLASGVLLLVPSLGLSALPGWVVWVAFPLATLAGHLVIGLGRNMSVTRIAALVGGGGSLVLALIATVLFFGENAGLMAPQGDSTTLWVLTGVGYIQGGLLWSLGMRMGTAGASKA
jgi:hypothetical protein